MLIAVTHEESANNLQLHTHLLCHERPTAFPPNQDNIQVLIGSNSLQRGKNTIQQRNSKCTIDIPPFSLNYNLNFTLIGYSCPNDQRDTNISINM